MLSLLNLFRAFSYKRIYFIRSIENHNRVLCSTSTIAAKLDESISSDFKTLTTLWKDDKTSTKITNFLFQCFSKEIDCYSFALNLLKQTNEVGFEQFKALNAIIIIALDDWLEKNDPHKQLTLDMKRKALNLSTCFWDRSVIPLFFKVYKIQEDSHILKDYVEVLLNDGKYEEAFYCVDALNMYNEIPLEKLLLPLAVRGKTNLVIKYLTSQPELQITVAKKVDELIGDIDSDEARKLYIRSNKSLSKCLSAIIQTFNIPLDLCPNIQKKKATASMFFLLNKKLEKSISDSSWEHMIIKLITNYPGLQKLLIQKLSYSDHAMAVKLAKYFNVPVTDLPLSVTEVVSSRMGGHSNDSNFFLKEDPLSEESKETKTPLEYLSLNTDNASIHFIDTADDYYNCITDITENYKIVGVDSEWKAQFGFEKLRLSLVQLAVKDKVYILDILALDNHLQPEKWNLLMNKIFANPHLLKLGCGIMQDVQMLVEDYKGPQNQKIKFSHVLDIGILFEQLESLYQFELRDYMHDPPGTRGLSKLCQIILDKPLNKRERICDWEIRPLTDSQISYAALDAYCQLQMFEKFQERCKRHSFDLEKAVHTALDITASTSKTACKVKSHYKWERQMHSFVFLPYVHVHDLKAIVEPSFSALGLKLRMFGADVTFLDDVENHVNDIKESLEEKKAYFLSRNTYKKVQKYLPEEKCYIIDEEGAIDEKTVAHIFKKFNVHMSTIAIYSRCMNCNDINFMTIPSQDLKQMWSNSQTVVTNCAENEPNSKQDTSIYENVSISTNGTLDSGIHIQLRNISPDLFSQMETFKVCQSCGHIQCQR